jgi:hypothetical protein
MVSLQRKLVLVSLVGIVMHLAAAFRNKTADGLPLWLTLAYFTAVYLPFVAFSRYGYPNMFLLILFAAYAADTLVQIFRGTSRKTGTKAGPPSVPPRMPAA